MLRFASYMISHHLPYIEKKERKKERKKEEEKKKKKGQRQLQK